MREILLSEFCESIFKKIDKFSINTRMQESYIYIILLLLGAICF